MRIARSLEMFVVPRARFASERDASGRQQLIESRKLKPLDVSTFGDFPPQWVR
jgi:hypothetical protein